MATNPFPAGTQPAAEAHPSGLGLRGFASLVGRWVNPDQTDRPVAPSTATFNFPPDALPIGRWIAWHRDGLGNNDLSDLQLIWYAADVEADHGLPEFAAHQPCGPCGFEHFLNCLLPADHDSQWQSIKRQLLAQEKVALSQVRMRIDNLTVKSVWVRRVFTYSSVNGELLGLELQLAI